MKKRALIGGIVAAVAVLAIGGGYDGRKAEPSARLLQRRR